MNETEKRAKAWVGDAVLALFAREWILGQSDIEAGDRMEVFTRMTSNQFLACFAEPTLVEAEIGVAYESGGLASAFEYIESKLLPVFKKQRRNWLRNRRSYRDRK